VVSSCRIQIPVHARNGGSDSARSVPAASAAGIGCSSASAGRTTGSSGVSPPAPSRRFGQSRLPGPPLSSKRSRSQPATLQASCDLRRFPVG